MELWRKRSRRVRWDGGTSIVLPTKPSGMVVGAVEVGALGEGVDEVEVGAVKGAGGGQVAAAVEPCESGETDQGDQWQPVAGGAIGSDRTDAERAEGRGAEGLERVERGHDGMRILKDEGAGGNAEDSVEGVVGAGDLDAALAGELALRI